jgi:UDPglucose--hexose-1-phosphate uridylyltransferase
MPHTEPFDAHTEQYDAWFDQHPAAFDAEVRALQALTPSTGRRVEIGVGTGRFAQALGIDEGLDPSSAMRERATARGIRVQDGVAEDLPYPDASIDVVLLVTTICFVDDLDQALSEVVRVLRPGGALVVGLVDREQPLGRRYKKQKHASVFYQAARFYTTGEVVDALRTAGLQGFAFRQTLQQWPMPNGAVPEVEVGYGQGAFVALRGRKPVPAPDVVAAPPGGVSGVNREIRHNRLTGRDVVIAPSRSSRPKETDAGLTGAARGNPASCPFCVGNDEMLPYLIDEFSAPNGAPWQTRVVPNKYAALDRTAPAPAPHPPFFAGHHAHGRQEVIIEAPDHMVDLPDLSIPALDTVLATYQARYRALRAEDPSLVPFVFRNYGGRAGASIHHAHSQLIATHSIPSAVEAEQHRAHIYHRATGQCLVCEMRRREKEEGVRVIQSTEHYLAVVPFAAEVPFEVIILPQRHAPHVVHVPAEERRDLAHMLRDVLRRLRAYCVNSPYNYFLRTPGRADGQAAPHLHWYLRVMPRTKQEAGFELSTDLRINPSSPEADAAGLRTALDK